jgi:exopolyphosphatase/pppGpp-phosphohydrolase
MATIASGNAASPLAITGLTRSQCGGIVRAGELRRTLRWARRRLGTVDHERRVASVAATLFHLTRERHELPPTDLRLLILASIVHDVGRKVNDKRHPTIGARMILRDIGGLRISESDRRCLAYLTRYHRGAVPEIGYDDILTAADNRKRMRRVLALLRAADALDGRQINSPRLVLAMTGRKLSIRCYLDALTPKAKRFFKRRKKFRLMEELLDCRVTVAVRRAQVVHTVA